MDHPEELPYLPQSEAEQNKMCYLLQSLTHPFPEVRADAITQLNELPPPIILQRLVELLADSQQIVRDAAAATLWSWAEQPHPVVNSLAFALRYLRDAIQGTDLLPLSNRDAWGAFYFLRQTRPMAHEIFNQWCLYIWCRSDPVLTQHGQELCLLHQRFGNFVGVPRQLIRHIGIKLALVGGEDALQTVREAIRITQGRAAAYELDELWADIENYLHEQINGDMGTPSLDLPTPSDLSFLFHPFCQTPQPMSQPYFLAGQ